MYALFTKTINPEVTLPFYREQITHTHTHTHTHTLHGGLFIMIRILFANFSINYQEYRILNKTHN